MKKFIYILDDIYLDTFFPHYRIKNKIQILEILFEATRYLLYGAQILSSTKDTQLILKVDKMSRLFFFNKTKFYSLIFPFTVLVQDEGLKIWYKDLVEINSKTISDILSILKDEKFQSTDCLDFADVILNLEPEYDNNLWILIKELLLLEDGYVRFDHDLETYLEAKKKGEQHKHPEHHLDIFYTSNNTFKIGLSRLINPDIFIDYLDVNKDCSYLKNFH